MKIVECIEKPIQNSVKDYLKLYKSKKSMENETISNNSYVLDENENKKFRSNYNKQKLYKYKKNILYHWYLESKDNIENKCFDIEKDKMQFCKTNFNFN